MLSNPNQKSRTRDNNGTLTIRQNMKHITVNALRSFIGLWIMTNIRFFPELKLKFSDYSGHSDLLSNVEMSQGYFGTREAPIITWWLCANKLAEYVVMTFHRSQDSPVWSMFCTFDTLRLRQNGCHFPDDIFKCIFLNENIYISITISLKFVPKGPIDNIPALVQIMAWRHPATSHYLNQWWLVQRRIYASLGLNELIRRASDKMAAILQKILSSAFPWTKTSEF